jgi:hypothetical protein
VTNDVAAQREATDIQRPPTLFGQQSPWELVTAGHGAARRAIGLALERVEAPEPEKSLADSFSVDELRMAFHFLAWTRFDVPVPEQASALFLIEAALNLAQEMQHQPWTTRVLEHVRGWYDHLRDRLGLGTSQPGGLAPAC